MNLRGAVQQELSRLRRFLVVPEGVVVSPSPPGCKGPATAPPRRRLSAVIAHQRSIAHERWALQLTRFRRVKGLQASGWSAGAIMRETGLGRAYVRKWVYLSELPTRNRMAPRPGMPDFYRAHLQRRWAEGCHSGRVLLAEIQTLGYGGCYSGLARLLAVWRDPVSVRRDTPVATDTPMVRVRHLSPQIAAALLGQPRPLLSDRQAAAVDVLKQQCPGFTRMRRLVLSFVRSCATARSPRCVAGCGGRSPRTSTRCSGLSARFVKILAPWKGPSANRGAMGPWRATLIG